MATGRIRPRAAAGVLAGLSDLHDGAELGRLAQLALADRAGVGMCHRDEPVGDLLAETRFWIWWQTLPARSASRSMRWGRAELGLGAAAAGAPRKVAARRRASHRAGGEVAGLTGQLQREVFALAGASGA